MPTPGAAANFAVIQFSLEVGEGNRPSQRAHNWGTHVSVEDAFAQARSLAHGACERLRMERSGPAPTLLDTEWGYDLRLGALTVHRFWVHENIRTQRLLG